jgi:O-antigen ligase
LNYWNALAALMALGLPLLLTIASTARRLGTQAAAAAAIPLVILCGYLTFSRGGALEATGAVLVFLLFAPDRIPKLATLAVAATGGAVLIAGAIHRTAIEHGLTNAVAHRQGGTLFVSILLVCAGVGLAQCGIGLAVRHGTPPRWLTVSPRQARLLFAGAVVVVVVAALAAGAPSRLNHAWQDFKKPQGLALQERAIGRFGTVSGNGRYDYWKAALHATSGHLLGGSGPGTYVLLWQKRAPYYSPVQNAHSLYFETLAEVGLVGLALLLGFLALVIGAAIRATVRARYEQRTRAAAVAATLVGFALAAGVDWVWQMPALPAVFLLLGAAVLVRRVPVGASRAAVGERGGTGALITRIGAVVLALASLVAIAIPLATTNAVRQSQDAAAAGNLSLALSDARKAINLEPGAASPRLQAAQVLEAQRDLPGAVANARLATVDEPSNWTTWLVLARIDAEAGHDRAATAAFERARSLNPHSPLFVTLRHAALNPTNR